MLQRYDISMDFETNSLSIREFAALGRVSRKKNHFKTAEEKYSMIQKVSYDGDIIRSAIDKGKGALVSVIRSNEFFPIQSCVDIIVERVIELFKNNSNSCSEVVIDDHDQFPGVHE
ncbi:MAG: hypothetical protein JRI53_01770 [Deltaproteobacteria bacterium]|nr:hypothetical protein [Deltaproteobacteria bacterium]